MTIVEAVAGTASNVAGERAIARVVGNRACSSATLSNQTTRPSPCAHLCGVVVMGGEMAMGNRMRMVCVGLVNVFRRDES